MESPRRIFLRQFILKFLEYCYKNLKVELYSDYLHGKEKQIVNDFLDEWDGVNEEENE